MHPTADSGKIEQEKHSTERFTRFSAPEKDLETDEDTIFEEVGHFRNRDEVLTDGNRIIQGGDSSDIDDSWTYERYDRLLGDVAQSSEAVDIQLSKVDGITDDIRDTRSHHDSTPAIPIDDRRDEFDALSDKELISVADSFGIPDRQGLPRDKLIRKIRAVEMRGL